MDFHSGRKICIDFDKTKNSYAVRIASEVVFSNKSKARCEEWLQEQRDYEQLVEKFFTLPVPGQNPLKLVYPLKKTG